MLPSRAVGSGHCPRKNPMHLIRCDSPASTSSANPTRINSLTGQRISPPEFDDCSPLRYESMNTGHDRTMIRMHAGSRKNTTPKISIQICLVARQPRGQNVHPHVLVLQQRVARGQQEHRAERCTTAVPARRSNCYETPAHHGVAGADQTTSKVTHVTARPTRKVQRVLCRAIRRVMPACIPRYEYVGMETGSMARRARAPRWRGLALEPHQQREQAMPMTASTVRPRTRARRRRCPLRAHDHVAQPGQRRTKNEGYTNPTRRMTVKTPT